MVVKLFIAVSWLSQAILILSLCKNISSGILVPFSAFLAAYQSVSDKNIFAEILASSICFSFNCANVSDQVLLFTV